MTQPGDWTQASRAIGEHSNHYASVVAIKKGALGSLSTQGRQLYFIIMLNVS